MKYKKSLILIFLVFLSCETVIDVDVPREPAKLVVNSFFNPDSTVGVTLFESQYVLDDAQHNFVSEADVVIADEDGNQLARLTESADGIYESDFMPETGKSYQVRVSKNGYQTVYGIDKIPSAPASVSKVKAEEEPSENEYYSSYYYETTFTISDPPGDDYYEAYILVEYEVWFDTLYYSERRVQYLESEDAVFDDFNNSSRFLLFSDALFEGKNQEISVNSYFDYPRCGEECEANVEISLNVRKVSERYYKYKRTYALQQSLGGDPFAEPVSVYNNIENGYGIFAGFQTSKYSIPVPEEKFSP